VPGPLPFVFGAEVAGTVTATGEGVDPSLMGNRVVALTGVGAYADEVVAPAIMVAVVPDEVTAVDAVAATTSAATAMLLLRAARLEGNERLLVEGASGTIGGYLVQLAKARPGTTVIATASSAARQAYATDLGADAVIDHRLPDWPDRIGDLLGPEKIDVVFEAIGGDSARSLLPLLQPATGRMVFYGSLSGKQPAVTPMDLLVRGVSLIGAGGMAAVGPLLPKARADALAQLAAGTLRPLVDRVLPLADAAKAHQLIEDRDTVGKIVLTP
jgi:NADPH:quinone reductase